MLAEHTCLYIIVDTVVWYALTGIKMTYLKNVLYYSIFVINLLPSHANFVAVEYKFNLMYKIPYEFRIELLPSYWYNNTVCIGLFYSYYKKYIINYKM